MLRAAVDQLTALGVSPVYVVCHQDNIGSVCVIEKNGGTLLSAFPDEDGRMLQCYRMP